MAHVIRADVIGSLLRPTVLLEARSRYDSGDLDRASFKRMEDRAVDMAIALQELAGVDVVTDGEMRRLWFTGALSEAIGGIEEVDFVAETSWHGEGREEKLRSPLAITGKLTYHHSLVSEEYSYARSRAHQPVKVTLPSPMMLAEFWSPTHSVAAYGNLSNMLADAAELLSREITTLINLGCGYIQIDAPELGVLVDPSQRAFYEQVGMDPDGMLSEGIDLINSLAGIDADVVFSMHMCRGNYQSMWMAEGGYEAISQAVFRRATNIDRFCLEYDDYRSGSFEPLSDVPDDKTVVLGLVSSKSASLESADGLKKRIEEAANYFPKDQLAISTQCGFASVAAGGNLLTPDDELSKLALVASISRDVWGERG
jgi:5-methyltetrahydropteroyltriglutamate--homocysteine methyltransferase